MKNTLKALVLALSLSGLAHAGSVPLQQMLSLRGLNQQFVKNDTPIGKAYFALWQQCAYPVIASNTYFQQEYETAPDLVAFLSTLTYVDAQNQPMLAKVPGGTNNPICSNPQGCTMTCSSLQQSVEKNSQDWMKGTPPGPRETVQCDSDGCEMSGTQIVVKSKAFAQATRPTALHMNMEMDCAIVPGSELARCDMKIKTESSDK